MAVIFGEKQKDGWLKVTLVQYQMDKHPNGHTVRVEDIPPYPLHKPGVGHVQLYNPKTRKFRYQKVAIPLTQEEAVQELTQAVRELRDEIRAMRKKDKHI